MVDPALPPPVDGDMKLDLVTLTVATVFVTAVVGLLLLFAWSQNRQVQALGWWGTSLLGAVVAFGLLLGRGTLPGWLSIGAANAILFVGYGVFWAGFRVFERRDAHPMWMAAGALAWLASCGVPDIYKSFEMRVGIASLISSSYCFASAYEVWRGRSERLGSRWPIVGCLVLHALMTLSRYPLLQASGTGAESTVFSAPWLVPHAFEALLFTVAIAFLLLGITKERVEAEQRAIAGRDALTGILNRRAFFEASRELLDRGRREGRPCALLLADLDHFKRINDSFGHAAGDDVLCGFCDVALQELPPGALLARIGGEEFACLVPAGDAAALQLADGIRRGFGSARFETDREAFTATVSIGIATTQEAGHILDALLATADVALYRAKNEGRNRVARPVLVPVDDQPAIALAA